MSTLRTYRAVKPFRCRGRILWAGDKVVMREDVAREYVDRGELREATAALTSDRTSWGEPMLRR